MHKDETLPVKVIANTAQQFNFLSGLVTRLHPDFVKQFETIEHRGALGTTLTSTKYLSDKTLRLIGSMRWLQETESIVYISTTYKVINVGVDIIIDDKEHNLMLIFQVSENRKLDFQTWTKDYLIPATKK